MESVIVERIFVSGYGWVNWGERWNRATYMFLTISDNHPGTVRVFNPMVGRHSHTLALVLGVF